MNRGNYQKTPLGVSLNRISQQVVGTAVQQFGKALPCSVVKARGQIVTVKFEVSSTFTLPQVTCPIFGAEYVRCPTQPGDKGVVFPADAYLGGMSGLGGGVATLTPRSNLSSLVFFPIGNTAFSSVDPNAVTIYGPNGVVMRDTTGAASVTLLPTSITLACGGHTVVISAAGIVLDGIVWGTHVHPGIMPGGSETDPPA